MREVQRQKQNEEGKKEERENRQQGADEWFSGFKEVQYSPITGFLKSLLPASNKSPST